MSFVVGWRKKDTPSKTVEVCPFRSADKISGLAMMFNRVWGSGFPARGKTYRVNGISEGHSPDRTDETRCVWWNLLRDQFIQSYSAKLRKYEDECYSTKRKKYTLQPKVENKLCHPWNISVYWIE